MTRRRVGFIESILDEHDEATKMDCFGVLHEGLSRFIDDHTVEVACRCSECGRRWTWRESVHRLIDDGRYVPADGLTLA